MSDYQDPHRKRSTTNERSNSQKRPRDTNKKNQRGGRSKPTQTRASWKDNFVSFNYPKIEPTTETNPDFPNILIPASDATNSFCVLWHSPTPFIPNSIEEALLPILLHWGKTERQMIWKQPGFRARQIRNACQKHGVDIQMACSLRRQHIQHHHRFLNLERLGLGSDTDIRRSAAVFESVIWEALSRMGVNESHVWLESELVAHNKSRIDENGKKLPSPPTPDLLFKKPIRFKKYKTKEDEVYDEHWVHWLDAKMFYGASSIPQNKKSAVGHLSGTVDKYCKWYGTGALVFMQGCGDELAVTLAEKGCMVLDCTGSTVDLRPVHEDQRLWCADSEGNILP